MSYKFILGAAPYNDNDDYAFTFTDPETLRDMDIDNKIDEAIEIENCQGMLYLAENGGEDWNDLVDFISNDLVKIPKREIRKQIYENLVAFQQREA